MAKKVLTPSQQIIEKDITRYKKNSKASNFALLSLVFECLYFLVVYGQKAGDDVKAMFSDGTSVYTYMMGISVILNLIILLGVFLASEELKNYNKNYSYVVLVFGIIQIVRIFIYPMQTLTKTLVSGDTIFGAYSFTFMLVWLILSALCLFASAYFGFTGAVTREKYIKQLENNEIDLEAVLKEEDAFAAPVADKSSNNVSGGKLDA